MLDADRIRARGWTLHSLDRARFAHIETMLIPEELQMLNWLSHNLGDLGCVIDAGAFLGGSTAQLADGLSEHPDPLKKVHSFDLFKVPLHARGRYGLNVDENDTLGRYAENITPWADRVVIYPGDIMCAGWAPQPIELLFLDCLTSVKVNDWATRAFLPQLRPGSVVIQQDFLFPALPWIHVTMGYFADHLSYLADTGRNSVLYTCDKPITAAEAEAFSYEKLSRSERCDLFDSATARFTADAQRERLAGAREKIRG